MADAISPWVVEGYGASYVVPWSEYLQHLCYWLLCPQISSFWLLQCTYKPHKFLDLVNMTMSSYDCEFFLYNLVIKHGGLCTNNMMFVSPFFIVSNLHSTYGCNGSMFCGLISKDCMGIQSWRTEFVHFCTIHILVCMIVRAIISLGFRAWFRGCGLWAVMSVWLWAI